MLALPIKIDDEMSSLIQLIAEVPQPAIISKSLDLIPILTASFGGFCLNMMNLLEDSKKAKSKRVKKDSIYWIFFGFWPLLGGGLAAIYIRSGYNIDGILAFTTGLSAPTILQTLMTKTAVPEIKLEKVEE